MKTPKPGEDFKKSFEKLDAAASKYSPGSSLPEEELVELLDATRELAVLIEGYQLIKDSGMGLSAELVKELKLLEAKYRDKPLIGPLAERLTKLIGK